MNNFDKLRTIKTLKQLMVNHHCWEFCAWLRDIERTQYKNLRVDRLTCVIENITHIDFDFIKDLVDEYNVETEKIHNILHKEFLHLIREGKINSILN